MKKRILSTLLALVLVLGAISPALAAGMESFQPEYDDFEGKFTDLTAGAWYMESVQTAYELGLMLGTSGSTYSPDGSISIGSAIALACRLHSIYYTGQGSFVQGDPWYQVYVDYALENGIITQGQFADYNANATRREFAAILARALPAEALPAINTVEDGEIPDLAAGSANYDDIYMLYRAGILTGSDNYGTFAPETTIGRSSVAAIVARMAVPDLRRSFVLEHAVTGITLNKSTLGLGVGATETLTATVSPSDATDKTVTWTSSNTDVATVSGGVVTGKAVGSATITAATTNGKTATCTVTVSQMGTLANPYKADGSVTIPYQEYSFYPVKNIRINCVGELSGDAAAALAQSENQFNDTPNANQEWRFLEFDVTYVSCEGEEEVLEASKIIYDDTFFATSGSRVNVADTATLSNYFSGYGIYDVELYPGATGKVVIGLLMNKNAGDLLLRVPYNEGDSVHWVLCAPGTAGSLSDANAGTPGGTGTTKGYGQVKGTVTWKYNEFVGVRGDDGSSIMLIPDNDDVINYDNKLAAMLASGMDYESGILVTKCNGYGEFDFGDRVPAGTYRCLIVSKNTTSGYRFTNEEGWSAEIDQIFGKYFNSDDLETLKLFLGFQNIVTDTVTVEQGRCLTLSHDFGYTYI
ncbi:Ig-like domain-containing protein [Pseudoflavonifractor phocaeensis]|uniref:Ig-like domain-containing protein n=1 Tax=Pseudoflavonifractor phocaeensis TaxID=1870988 RepID=UPI001DCAE914|nr:S-layer homology domain-containing protein [Pseudoflavonifractor phocaeensis]MBM6926569.1 Ig-like domain-containing protein [Pseudoflavonifractor phocaeensis]